MDKKQYLKKRFESDFLRYSLLQEDSLSAKEIADKLYDAVDFDPLIGECRNKIDSLCDDYLSFDKVKVDGKLSNELSSELDYQLKDRIVDEFMAFMGGLTIDALLNDILKRVSRSVEQCAWSNGIVNMREAIEVLVDRLYDAAKGYVTLAAMPTNGDELLEKYHRAKENTLMERIQQNNIDDILEYRSALMEYVSAMCEKVLYANLDRAYCALADDAVLESLKGRFDALKKFALGLKESIGYCPTNDEWDREYCRLVPTDFYCRNVENITAEHAFHMTLLYLLAKNEEWMVGCGLLTDGELTAFTSQQPLQMDALLDKIESELF